MPQPSRKPKASAPAETAPAAPRRMLRPIAFDDPDVREIPIRDDIVLTVTLEHLTSKQASAIPFQMRTKHEDAYRAIWPYVLDWDVRAVDPDTGKTIPVPAPGHPDAPAFVAKYIGEEAEPWELLDYMLDRDTGSLVVSWLINPGGMKLATEQGKKSSTPSKPGDTPPDGDATATT
jgi:hypothetical protein